MQQLEGSCHCGAVRFTAKSHAPQPYMRCYCSICRKTAGGGGYTVNLMAEAASLKLRGRKDVAIYRARGTASEGDKKSSARRHFCKHCATALYISDPRWPAWIYPFASAIDTPLPAPAERAHIMLDDKPSWVAVARGARDKRFRDYPDQSIEDWHKTRGLYLE